MAFQSRDPQSGLPVGKGSVDGTRSGAELGPVRSNRDPQSGLPVGKGSADGTRSGAELGPVRSNRDPWQKFESTKRIQVEGGLATLRARGAMAETWWSKRFIAVLESFGLGGRMTRGRTYARGGQVLSLDVTEGLLVAQVQGSRRTPYAVTVRLQTPDTTQWVKITDTLRSRLGYAARLLDGTVPTDLEDVFTAAGSKLFPSQWRDLRATCSCPDWGDPCKHQAAVLYVFADQLDRDPWKLIEWLGKSKDEILALFAGSAVAGGVDREVAPWWPLRVDAPSGEVVSLVPAAVFPDCPHAALNRLGSLEATFADTPILDVIQRFYPLLQTPEDKPTFGIDEPTLGSNER